jgi:hypothetical protein
MPGEMRIGAIPFCIDTEMHDVLDGRLFCRIDERLALG